MLYSQIQSMQMFNRMEENHLVKTSLQFYISRLYSFSYFTYKYNFLPHLITNGKLTS